MWQVVSGIRDPFSVKHERPASAGLLEEAAEGTRTLDLLHGKWLLTERKVTKVPANPHEMWATHTSRQTAFSTNLHGFDN
jgi:hypothetical protein